MHARERKIVERLTAPGRLVKKEPPGLHSEKAHSSFDDTEHCTFKPNLRAIRRQVATTPHMRCLIVGRCDA